MRGIDFLKTKLTPENYRDILTPLLTKGEGQGFIVNLSVEVSSLDIIKLARELNVLYVDTVVEPWPGFYFDKSIGNEARTNYALRETVLDERRKNPGGSTAVSCCGANPGMVSWFVKQALVNLAQGHGRASRRSRQRAPNGARLRKSSASRESTSPSATRSARRNPKPRNVFVNTWSVEGFVSEGLQPAELGWGTHEKSLARHRRHASSRLRRGDLSALARRQYARALLDADAGAAIWLPRHP